MAESPGASTSPGGFFKWICSRRIVPPLPLLRSGTTPRSLGEVDGLVDVEEGAVDRIHVSSSTSESRKRRGGFAGEDLEAIESTVRLEAVDG